ncbi:hypothetical protein WISP_37774 [Willisornis vidua]|uniref:C2 domain-containing protein n=1 Tax=Willisornis vidua TaxID=1566151 RepID=A0ABQ9DNL4_9PASS|nr:hypothetical protein WISP_37774 [Willisornis vidua]
MMGKAEEPPIPLALQRSRLKAEEKTLDFEFEALSAQFNRQGCYALRLTVENPLLQGSGAGIQLRINRGNIVRSSTGTTDTIEQRHPHQICSFHRRKFTFTLPRGYTPDPASLSVQVSKSPARTEGPRNTPVAGGEHLARVGKETITITLHGASNLPATSEGRVPWPYVVIKTSGGAEQKPKASRPSSVPTHAPTWEEEVMVEMDAEDAGWADLTLTVKDKATKEALGTFQLPVQHLQPFQPHHCRLVLKQARAQDSVGMVLHVTITRKRSFIARCDGLSYVALQVLLRGLSPPMTTHPGTLVAVARVVSNVQEYKHRMEKNPISHPDISPTTITFPDPPADAFSIAQSANHGSPQISRPAGPQEQPSWNASFLFQGRDVATIFSEDAALAIEFYPHKAVWDVSGTLIPVGYSVLPLTSRVFQELAAWSSGMRVDGLAVERPAAFLTPSDSDALPSLDPVTLCTLKSSEEPQATPLYPLDGQVPADLWRSSGAGEALSREVHAALLAENHRLREELARVPHPAPPMAPQPSALPSVLGGTEKLSLLARLEEAQARGRALERQVSITPLHPT